MPEARWSLAVALVLLCAAACGAEPVASTSPAASPSTTSHSPSPAARVFTFTLNPAGPGITSRGTITVTARQKSTAVELKITGLQASSSHISHIHLGSCSGRGGIAFALNQVFADGQGNADVKTALDNTTYPPASGRWYAVVHAGPDMQGSNSSYLLCGNLF